MEEHNVNVNILPAGLLHTIFNSLGPRDLCSVSATCRHWRHLNQDAAANKVQLSSKSRSSKITEQL